MSKNFRGSRRMDLNPRVGKMALSRLSQDVFRCLSGLLSLSLLGATAKSNKQTNLKQNKSLLGKVPKVSLALALGAVACPLLRETQCNSLTRQCWKLPRISTAGRSLESFRYYLLSHSPLRRSLYKTRSL